MSLGQAIEQLVEMECRVQALERAVERLTGEAKDKEPEPYNESDTLP